MIASIIVAHIAAGFAFLWGATQDWSALLPHSQRFNKFAGFAMVVSLVLLAFMVVRSAR